MYYFLKIKKGFFKRHDIQLIDGRFKANGIKFYLWLLCESLDHAGRLRFSESEPYTVEEMAELANVDKRIAARLMDFLIDHRMVSVEEDGTFVVNTLEDYTAAETGAERTKRWREQKKAREETDTIRNSDDTVTSSNDTVTTPCQNIEYRIQNIEYREGNTDTISNNSIGGVVSCVPSREDEVVGLYERNFEAVWNLYPKQQGKDAARVAYIMARKAGTLHSEIMDGINRYIEYIRIEKIGTRYIKQLSNWLTQKGWKDKYKSNRKPTTADLAGKYDWSDMMKFDNKEDEA